MFSVMPKRNVDFRYALWLLSSYRVVITPVERVQDDPNSVILVITESDDPQYSHEDNLNEYGLAEMAFAGNFNTAAIPRLCPVCMDEIAKTGEGSAFCGHNTFTMFNGDKEI